jgi:hypothetical protein
MLNAVLKTERNYWSFYLLASIVFIFLFSGIFAQLLTTANYDDAFYVNMASSLLSQKWLGNYSPILLSKVPGYGIFLACCIASGIPYMLILASCYAVAVAFFLKTSLWLFEKARYLSLTMGIILLFNPLFASDTRIYRNPFSAICFLIFIGTIASLFTPKRDKETKLLRVSMGAVSFWGVGFLYFTREESVLYSGIMTLALLGFLIARNKIKLPWQNLRLPAMGIAGIMVLGLSISLLNYRHYGIFTICEKTSGAYPKAMKAFQQVADPWQDSFIPGISPSREKIKHIASVVPEFEPFANVLADSTNNAFRDCTVYFNSDSKQICKLDAKYVPASHFEWYWIVSLQRTGYYTNAKKASDYQKLIAEKIDKAFDDKKLEKRKIVASLGPYFIIKEDIVNIIRRLPMAYTDLFFTPGIFQKSFTHFSVKRSWEKNSQESERRWSNILNVRYLSATDNIDSNVLRLTLANRCWNLIVKLYAWLIVPVLHLATPLALLASFLCARKKKWNKAFLPLILVAGFGAHLLVLTIIDVVVGYKATNNFYYLPSYSAIIATFFISLANCIEYFYEVKISHTRNKLEQVIDIGKQNTP